MNKGTIELSASAIVILILALTVLGLIIGFLTTKFAFLTNKITITEPAPEATSEIPITLPGGKNTIELQKNTQASFEIGIYNPSASPAKIKKGTLLECTGAAELFYTLQTPVEEIKPYTKTKIPITLMPAGDIPSGEYGCALKFYDLEFTSAEGERQQPPPQAKTLIERTIFITIK
jgi:hypothetical protein